MSYIKVKKIWKKRFSDEEIVAIWNVFKKHAPKQGEWDEEEKVSNLLGSFGHFPYPETDNTDNTMGFEPKQIQEFLKHNSLEDLDKVLEILMYHIRVLYGYIDEDNVIDWKNVFDREIEPFLGKKLKGKLAIKLSQLRYRFSPEAVDIINDNFKKLYEFDESLVENNTVEAANLDNTAYLEKRKSLWQELKGFSPKSEIMLNSNPKNFRKEFLDVIHTLYGTRQIASLSEEQQKLISLINNLLGINSMVVNKEILLTANLLEKSDKNDFEIEDRREILSKVLKNNEMNIEEIFSLLKLLQNENFALELKKKDQIKKNEIEILQYIDLMTINLSEANKERVNKQCSFYFWKLFKRFGVNNIDEILSMVSLFENRNKTFDLPTIKGKIDKYEFKILDREDPLGLVLGYATDCCQVFGNQGECCLRNGFTHKDSGFFVVTKNEKIYAQSWCWIKEVNGKKGFCFDSIEILGGDKEEFKFSKEVLSAYLSAAEMLSEEYDYVFCGIDANAAPKGIKKLGRCVDPYDINMNIPNHLSGYTDTNELGVCILKERE